MECLDGFERFLHDDKHRLPALVEAGLMHVQFESIHPFLDGNGRLGRLLITLLLCSKGMITEPLLYPSLYLKSHRSHYYDLLQRIRTEGAWENWLQFFLEGIGVAAEEAANTGERTLRLFAKDKEHGRPPVFHGERSRPWSEWRVLLPSAVSVDRARCRSCRRTECDSRC
jgi:Fic family protein